ncbi:MAG TPA: hypothetical protein VFQ25_11880 [Ktedonobacterales bacterium]|nr:hypothetical protein [Ktedonobacterales bacterium]
MRLLATACDANHYDLTRDDQPVASLRLKVGGAGRIELTDGAALLLRREDALGARYVITYDMPTGAEPPAPLLRATRSNPLFRSYAVTIDGRQFTLRARSPWHGDYQLDEGGALAGLITPAGQSRNASATLPDDLPQDAALALFCLILTIWRQGYARVDTL